ncbi:GNAT family N-acetyltransferase [Herpetosiphon giganteus]|uniref:GNAT family N-acetyltransferase n=1 Tax=Herpetosiphon giganteus TaxID=2029754 RepID=UPI001958E219|nr:GNAT family N-acetyltransferase [Herpetosiphon giganteus]MBM7842618.1 GNAT superfamily N-acetyltransferase [Herpetosiphon giganteus]
MSLDHGIYMLREATTADLAGARQLMLHTFEHDFGIGYVAKWHADVDNLAGAYLANPRQVLFVAVVKATGEVVGTCAVRTSGPKAPYKPEWLVERYSTAETAQLVRVYVASDHRRAGLARRLVSLTRDWILNEGTYRTIYLHTNPAIAGAEHFWRSLPTSEIYDDRPDQGEFQNIHFEMDHTTPII